MALPLNVTDAQAVQAAARTVQDKQGLDVVMYCAGVYQPLRATDYNLAVMEQHMAVNYHGALYVLDAVLPALLAQGHGHLSLVSSVAGYRGLPQSLAYGPSKAALTHLGEALYLDLQDSGIGVSVINPGFVETPLTAQNTFTMPALITPAQAAQHILQGWRDGLFEIHFPKRFTLWLQLLRVLPYRWYFSLVRRATGL
jgi:NAD(P)-dependent dehydrogenase (short-subunit alcohol dehydrogenase family)